MLSLDDVRAMDAADPLAEWRGRFLLPEGVIYLDGNSLGALPAATPGRMDDLVRRQWGQDLIRSWNVHDWIGAPRRVGDKIARLIGAEAGEVVAADSTSVNIFKLLSAALAHDSGRKVVLTEPGDFPTDLYIAQGLAARFGAEVRTVEADRLADAIDTDVAVLMLTHVHYKSGRRRDMAALTAAAHAKGALTLWDLSHSAGAISVDLNAAGADLAVGCGYKYLNGGPGAPAFLFVARRLQAALSSPLTGWMGHAEPFAFIDDYRPASGVDRFLCGTPSILSMTALEAAVEMFLEADRAALYAKGQQLCDLFIAQVRPFADAHGLGLATPADGERRGSHVSFAHPHGYPLMQALIAHGVIGDFRTPDVVRFGFTPLYVGYEDVWRAAYRLKSLLETGEWRDPRYAVRAKVT
ncbi:MAG: kynureninase [Caulobacteraceae bacterium]